MLPLHRHVLLVDDDPAILRILSRMLERAGYLVRTASDGVQGLAAVDSLCPDFIVTDWDMPQMDGLELCRAVRARELEKYVYVFFLSSKTGTENMVTALDAGADDFFIKPVGQAELVARFRAGARVLELERRLSQLVRVDMLTGLPTRRNFTEQMNREFERARRHGLHLACVMLDIDYFKRINDTHGHAAGDAVLRRVGRVLAETCRASDVVCRFGGEEFCAVLPETSAADASQWAQRVRQAAAQEAIEFDGKPLRVTLTAGVAGLKPETLSPEKLVDEADQAMLVAKEAGRDRVVCFDAIDELRELDAVAAGRDDALRGVTAADCMTSPVATLREEQTAEDASDFFCRLRVNSAPVVDQNGKLVGILSEKDVLTTLMEAGTWSRRVRELMQTSVVSYELSTPIRQIYAFMCRVSIRRVIIVDDGVPVGVIDRASLLRWFHNWMSVSARPALADAAGHHTTQGRPCGESVHEAVAALASEARKLGANLAAAPEDLVPVVVGRVSRMQELLNDLLAYSRLAKHSLGLDDLEHLRF